MSQYFVCFWNRHKGKHNCATFCVFLESTQRKTHSRNVLCPWSNQIRHPMARREQRHDGNTGALRLPKCKTIFSLHYHIQHPTAPREQRRVAPRKINVKRLFHDCCTSLRAAPKAFPVQFVELHFPSFNLSIKGALRFVFHSHNNSLLFELRPKRLTPLQPPVTREW